MYIESNNSSFSVYLFSLTQYFYLQRVFFSYSIIIITILSSSVCLCYHSIPGMVSSAFICFVYCVILRHSCILCYVTSLFVTLVIIHTRLHFVTLLLENVLILIATPAAPTRVMFLFFLFFFSLF